MTSHAERALGRFLGFVLAVLVGFVVGMLRFGGQSWPAKGAAAGDIGSPTPAPLPPSSPSPSRCRSMPMGR